MSATNGKSVIYCQLCFYQTILYKYHKKSIASCHQIGVNHLLFCIISTAVSLCVTEIICFFFNFLNLGQKTIRTFLNYNGLYVHI